MIKPLFEDGFGEMFSMYNRPRNEINYFIYVINISQVHPSPTLLCSYSEDLVHVVKEKEYL
jgi:hypothetical protein